MRHGCARVCRSEHAHNGHVQFAGLGGAADSRGDHGRPSAAAQRQRKRNGIIGLGSPDRRNGRLLRTHSVRPCHIVRLIGDDLMQEVWTGYGHRSGLCSGGVSQIRNTSMICAEHAGCIVCMLCIEQRDGCWCYACIMGNLCWTADLLHRPSYNILKRAHYLSHGYYDGRCDQAVRIGHQCVWCLLTQYLY